MSHLNWSFLFPYHVSREKLSLPEVLVILAISQIYKHLRVLVWAAFQRYLLLRGGGSLWDCCRVWAVRGLTLFQLFLIPMSIFVGLKCCLQSYGRLRRTESERTRGLQRWVYSKSELFCMYHLSHCLPWGFPLPLSVATTADIGEKKHLFYFFLQRCCVVHKRIGDLCQSQFAFLSRSQNIAWPNKHITLGRKCKKITNKPNNWGGTGRHRDEKDIKDSKIGNGFFPPSILSCMWNNPSIHSYFIPLRFVQGSLECV